MFLPICWQICADYEKCCYLQLIVDLHVGSSWELRKSEISDLQKQLNLGINSIWYCRRLLSTEIQIVWRPQYQCNNYVLSKSDVPITLNVHGREYENKTSCTSLSSLASQRDTNCNRVSNELKRRNPFCGGGNISIRISLHTEQREFFYLKNGTKESDRNTIDSWALTSIYPFKWLRLRVVSSMSTE